MGRLLKLKDRIIARVFKFLTLNIIFPLVYKKAAKKPVDENKVVFVEVRLPQITNSFKVLFDEIVTNYDYTVHCHFLRNNAVRKHIYLRRCNDMLRDIATAKYIFVNEASNCISSVKMRPETKMTQLWHGCGAFKKFGLSTADLIFGESRKEQLKHPFYNNYTYVTISSPEVAWAYEEAMNLSDKKEIIVPTGSSRTDVFYDEEFIKNARETLNDLMPAAKGKKVVLYAPTFRGRVAKAKTSHMLNIEMFYEGLGDDYVVLFKHHPLAKGLPKVPAEYSDFARDMTIDMSIEDLLCVADVCITDYSSLVFEYSLFEKPIIFFAYDLDEYFDWRGFYYDYYEMSPGPIHTTNFEMIDYIKNLDTQFDKQRVKDFRYKFMRSCDGNATKRIMELVFSDIEKHKKSDLRPEPFNTVPYDDGSYYKEYLAEIEALKDIKKEAEAEYNKYISNDIVQGKVVLLNVSANMRKKISVFCKDAVMVKYKKDKLSDVIKAISDANYIFVDKDVELLDMLELKEDTKVVRMPADAFPFRKTDLATRAYRSNIYKDRYAVAPMNRKIDIVPICEKELLPVYEKAYNVKESSLLETGNPKTDLLFSKKFKDRTLKKFYEAHPEAKGKKILCNFVTRLDEVKATPEETRCDTYLYEYLKDDYIFLKYSSNSSCEISSMPMKNYKTIYDVTKELSVYETMVISDVMVGAYEDSLFTFMVTGRPAFAYAPMYRAKLHSIETNFDFEKTMPLPVYSDAKELAKAIVDIENYDYTKYNSFKEKMLKTCDGKATERLLTKLGLVR